MQWTVIGCFMWEVLWADVFVDGNVSAGCFVQVQGDTWGGAGPGGWHPVGLR